MTAFRTLREAIRTALLAAPALADGRVEEPRVAAIPLEWARFIEVRIAASVVTSPFVGPSAPRVARSDLEITVMVRAAAGGSTTATADDLLAAVDTRVRALSPGDVGALEFGADVRVVWEYAQGTTDLEAVTYAMTVTHDIGAGLAPR